MIIQRNFQPNSNIRKKLMIIRRIVTITAPLLVISMLASPAAFAQYCQNTGSFNVWLKGFKNEARSQGISERTINSALSGIKYNKKIVQRDRRQSFFSQSFLEVSGRMISKNRIVTGSKRMKQYKRVFDSVEKSYGVPAPVIAAFWALESDFGVNMGKDKSLRSLATLAFDCRRPELFRPELMAALKIIDRGDLRAKEMIGSWAGELGQTQFLPTHYYNHAVDFDGDGRRNLLKSAPDVIASTGAFLNHLGWHANEPWLKEVRIPSKMRWDQADLQIQHPRSKWVAWGVKQANGSPLRSDGLPASLLLPMGRKGPAFLAFNNFQIYLQWNQSLVYATTAAYLATRYDGAGPVRKGSKNIKVFGYKDIKVLQRRLTSKGYDVGGIDGKMGIKTRSSVKSAQIKLGLPADSYPTPELMNRLR